MATIGVIDILLRANSAKFDAAMKKASSSLTGFLKIAGGTAIAHRLGRFILDTISDVDELANSINRLGVDAKVFQTLEYSAKLSNVSIEQLTTAFTMLNRKISESADKDSGAAKTFKSLKLSFDELARLSPDEAFLKVGDALSKVSSSFDKANIAQEIYGRGGQGLINVVSQGSQGLRELQAELERTGRLMSQEALDDVQALDDKITHLKLTLTSLSRSFAGELADAIQGWQYLVAKATGTSDEFIETLMKEQRILERTRIAQRNSFRDMDKNRLQDELDDIKKNRFKELQSRAESIRLETRLPNEKFKEDMQELGALLRSGLLPWENYRRAVEAAREELLAVEDIKLNKPKPVGMGQEFSPSRTSFFTGSSKLTTQAVKDPQLVATNKFLASIDRNTKNRQLSNTARFN